MEGLIMTGQLLLALSILVGLHELGHLLTAKMFGMRVEKYYIGFPPKIIGYKWGETEYCLGMIPLGGFVNISGMIDESMDKEQMKQEPQPYEFRSKPAWQRLIVMMGGIIVNVITGIIIFIFILYNNGTSYLPAKEVNKNGIVAYDLAQDIGLKTGDKIIQVNGKSYEKFTDVISSDVLLGQNSSYTVERNGETKKIEIPNDMISRFTDRNQRQTFITPITTFTVEDIQEDSPAEKAGLKAGDKITAITYQASPNISKWVKSPENKTEEKTREIRYFHELREVLGQNKDKEIKVQIKRGEQSKELKAKVSENGTLGFYPTLHTEKAQVQEYYSFGESVVKGTGDAFKVVYDNIKGFGKIFRGEVSASDSLSGPIGIARIFGGTWDWGRFWRLTGLLSMILAFMNFLPIPALDGGHVMFLLFEMISGRKPSDKFMEIAQTVGMILLLALMVFAFGNDIYKLFV